MMTQIVGMQQIVITIVFLSCLIGLLIFLRIKGGLIRANLQKGQRIRVVEETAVGPGERLRLITIDSCEFLMLSGKGIQPSIVPLSTAVPRVHPSFPSEQVVQAPLDLTTQVLPQVSEQAVDTASPNDRSPQQIDSPQMDPGEVAAFAAKFKGWRKN